MNSYTAACFDCRYPLDGLPSRECPECGREFDPDDVGSFNRVLSDPVKITQRLLNDAVLLRLKLEHAGIPTALEEQTGGVIMYAPVPMAALYVNRDQKDAAEKVINSPQIDDEESESAEPWTCSNCGEEVEGNFDICWNCGAEHNDM